VCLKTQFTVPLEDFSEHILDLDI